MPSWLPLTANSRRQSRQRKERAGLCTDDSEELKADGRNQCALRFLMERSQAKNGMGSRSKLAERLPAIFSIPPNHHQQLAEKEKNLGTFLAVVAPPSVS